MDFHKHSKVMTDTNASEVEIVNAEGDSTLTNKVTSLDQICSTELLDASIEDARSKKNTLVSAMDSVITLMREVECEEKAAEEAKNKAATSSMDILLKLANVVYSQRGILVTEMEELRLRVASLLDDGDGSLAVFDEKQISMGESRPSVPLADHLLILHISFVEKQEGIKNWVCGTDVKDAHGVLDKKGITMSNEGLVASAKTHVERVVLPSTIKSDNFENLQEIRLPRGRFCAKRLKKVKIKALRAVSKRKGGVDHNEYCYDDIQTTELIETLIAVLFSSRLSTSPMPELRSAANFRPLC